MTSIIGPTLRREAECEAILRSLPQWFGIEDSVISYARDSGVMPTFAVDGAQGLVGFITLMEHFPASWEVHCIAVSASVRGTGIGTRLLAHAEKWLAQRGARFLQIKTIAAKKTDPHYDQTREYYIRRGYSPVEVFPTIWHPSNPALQLIKALT
ncbi:MAG: hypothetical protein A3H44_06405 [Gammaproteobacteria bacterium RIFCSPLOWO2_02_FULL_57_10]|nr:MAG: hypothetical protein A3H44_06405 [Gammaproteobacteria bacterium RIFCSPLOWO2_02_FULL_57_10]